jgi:hypothetical protein
MGYIFGVSNLVSLLTGGLEAFLSVAVYWALRMSPMSSIL